MKKILMFTHNPKSPYFLVWLFLLLHSFTGLAQTMTRPDKLFIQKGIQWQSWIRVDGAAEINEAPRRIAIPINRTGQYIRIQAPHTDPLSLAEVQVFSQGVNVALQKNTQQSSNIDGTHGFSHLAIDGNTDGIYTNGSVTHTLGGNAAIEPWWEVDLGSPVPIDSIQIWNRTDKCCDQQIKGFYLFVSNAPYNATTLAGTITQAGVSWYTQPGVDHYPVGAELAGIGFAPTYYERPMYNYTIHQRNPSVQWSLAKACYSSGIENPTSFEQSNGFLNSLQLANVNNLASICFGDEEYFSNDMVDQYKAWFDISKSKYPNVLVHNNQWFDQWDSDEYAYYIAKAQPDLLTFDNYYFFAYGGNYHSEPVANGSSFSPILGDCTKFRTAALKGGDGSGKDPIAYGAYLMAEQWFPYYISECEINIQAYSYLVMGAKWLNVFRYLGGDGAYFTREDGSLSPQYRQFANVGAEVKNLSPHLSRLRSTDVRFIPGQHMLAGSVKTNPSAENIAAWDPAAGPYVTAITATNLVSTTNNGLRGDVAVGYFRPVPGIANTPGITMAPVTGKDVRYFMIMNGLIRSNGCCKYPGSPHPCCDPSVPSDISQDTIRGKAALCKQSIVLNIDFKSNPIDTLYRVRRSDGLVEMVNLTHVSGTQYSFADTLDGGKADLFYWKNAAAAGSGIISGAIYTLVSAVNDSSALDVTGGATGNGTPVQLYQSNSGPAQQWIVTSTGDGYYKLQPVNAPGKALDVEGALSADGTKVQIWESNNTNAQKWTITPVDGSYYNLSPACASGSNLDVAGAGTANGTKVQLSGFNISPAQKWRLAPATTSGAGIAKMLPNAALQHAENSPAGKLYPNPVTNGVLYVDLSSAAMANSTISVIDITGKTVYSVSKSLAKGSNHMGINVATLSGGTYILQIKQNNKTEQYRFIIPKK